MPEELIYMSFSQSRPFTWHLAGILVNNLTLHIPHKTYSAHKS